MRIPDDAPGRFSPRRTQRSELFRVDSTVASKEARVLLFVHAMNSMSSGS
jgi:hypothetical protein